MWRKRLQRRRTPHKMVWHYLKRFLHTTTPQLKIVPKNLKGKSKSSQEWLIRQLNDPYVKKAQQMNYRARSAFKLIEIDDKIKILKPGLVIVECGAAPGAWTQVLIQKTNSDGKNPGKPKSIVIAIDLLDIAPLTGAILLPGCNFTSPETQQKINKILHDLDESKTNSPNALEAKNDENKPSVIKQCVDIVISDMAPNASGMKDLDHPRIINLVKSALNFSLKNGKPGSHFLSKIWDGSEAFKLEKELGMFYQNVMRLKVPCSRKDSAEIFLFAKSKKV